MKARPLFAWSDAVLAGLATRLTAGLATWSADWGLGVSSPRARALAIETLPGDAQGSALSSHAWLRVPAAFESACRARWFPGDAPSADARALALRAEAALRLQLLRVLGLAAEGEGERDQRIQGDHGDRDDGVDRGDPGEHSAPPRWPRLRDTLRQPWSGGVQVELEIEKVRLELWLAGTVVAGLSAQTGAVRSVAATGTALIPLTDAMAGSPVPVDAWLEPVTLTLQQLRTLRVDDVIRLPHALDHALILRAAGSRSEPVLCEAWLGRRGERRAVRLARAPAEGRPQAAQARRADPAGHGQHIDAATAQSLRPIRPIRSTQSIQSIQSLRSTGSRA